MYMDIDELVRNLDRIQNDYPREAEAALESGARRLLREVRKATPVGKARHKNKLKKGWKMRMAGFTAASTEVHVWNRSPHFHLVERGHVIKTPKGKVKGYRQGTFFFQKAVKENIDDITEDIHERLFSAVEKRL